MKLKVIPLLILVILGGSIGGVFILGIGIGVIPLQPPTPIEHQKGIVSGRVSIGPLCPVEPCPDSQPDIYSSREVVLQPEAGSPIYVKLNPDGSFQAEVNAGRYTVNLTDCVFLGCSSTLPMAVTVEPNRVTNVDISIDTGIR